MSSTAADVVTVHDAELIRPRQSGRRLRAYCHLHGGDHQRSLSIETAGEYAGYGFCHTCKARVFVPEMNPQEAERRARGEGRTYQRQARRITGRDLLASRPQPVRSQPTPADWQQAELATLVTLDDRMRAHLADDRPRAYLAARGIPFDFASRAGVGYIPADAPAKVRGVDISKWRDRLIFPLGSPDGRGYAGRSLWGWQPGMDENAHKALLDASAADGAPRRWEKTYPAGWLGYDALASADSAVFVEGPVDALALYAAGLGGVDGTPVVALVGTAAYAEWIPAKVRGVVLALDGDGPGSDAARTLVHDLGDAGVQIVACVPRVEDGRGKDWAERWRLASWDGIGPVFDALDELIERIGQAPAFTLPALPSLPDALPVAPAPLRASDEPRAAHSQAHIWALARADVIVGYLLAHGLTLADVRAV